MLDIKMDTEARNSMIFIESHARFITANQEVPKIRIRLLQ